MSMQTTSDNSSGEPMMDINTTPLIDVMLVLLIMFIITIPIQTHAVKLDMPQGTPPPALVQPEIVRLDIDFDGTILWNGKALPDRATLEQYLRAAAAQSPQPEIHLAPNKLAKYASVAEVLAESQRLGVTKLGIVGSEQFME
jgi:biopolymer transport protein ExbD